MSGSDVHDWSYYKKCMAGGILSCGITHALVCPLDIVKCRMQVSTRNEFFSFNAVFFLIGYARYVQGCQWWFQDHLRFRGYQGILHRKYILSCQFSSLLLYRVSSQPGLVTLSKDSVNSDSMRCSRTFTETPWDLTRKSRNIKLSDSLFPPHALRSSPIVSSAHGKL